MKFLPSLLTLCFLFNIPEKGVCQQNDRESGCLSAYRFNGVKLTLTEQEWKDRLTKEEFEVLRQGGTEPAYDNLYNDNKEKGIYVCKACSLPLYDSNAKYDSKTGWPSFWEPICPQNVLLRKETGFLSLFSSRIEVLCARCNSHIGHVFDDGPPPTGKRYCMNSIALRFIPQKNLE